MALMRVACLMVVVLLAGWAHAMTDADPCNAFTNCGDCTVQSTCGWCPLTSSCLTGNINGPAMGSCASQQDIGQWEFNTCATSYTTCQACTADPSCGWCGFFGRCYIGNVTGPAYGLSCPSDPTLGQWEFSSCCLLNGPDCASCLKAGPCGWCPFWSRCYLGSVSGPSEGLSCPAEERLGAWEWTACCNTLSGCADCTSVPDCGFCPSNGACYVGSAAGPSEGLNCTSNGRSGNWSYGPSTCSALDGPIAPLRPMRIN